MYPEFSFPFSVFVFTGGVGLDDGMSQAERLEKVAVALSAMLHQLEATRQASSQSIEGEWSVNQILGHMAEMIPYWMQHCDRIIVAQEALYRFGRSHAAEERLAGVERGAQGELAELLLLVEGEIQSAAKTIRGMSPAERSRQGLHIRDGALSVAQVIERFIVVHAEEHLTQIEMAVLG